MSNDHSGRPSAQEVRWFGLLLGAFFGLVGALILWRTSSLDWAVTFWSIGALLASFYYLVRPLQIPIYKAWMRLTFPIGLVVSNAILGIIYFGMFVPLGRLMALFGRDKLERRIDRSTASYWTKRPATADHAQYLRQS